MKAAKEGKVKIPLFTRLFLFFFYICNMPTAVITGATQGIGKAIAEKFLKEGYDLAICARTTNDLRDLHDNWEDRFPERKIFMQNVDVQDKTLVKKFAHNLQEEFPRIDVLVNNAGSYLPGNLTEEPEGQLEHLIEVNLYSAYHLTRALLPALLRNGKGHIFNMCSVAALQAYPNGGAYSVSKYALLGFSDNLRHELKDKNIKVTAINAGAVWTNSWSGSGIAEERIMQAGDIAHLVWAATNLSPQATVENIIIRPQLGDL
jgi:short-subunit dehydrogenase